LFEKDDIILYLCRKKVMTLKCEKQVQPASSEDAALVSDVAVRASARAENALAKAEAKVVKILAAAEAKAQKIVERAHAKASKIDEKAQARKLAQAEKAKKKAEKAEKTAADTVVKEKKQYKVRNWKEYNESLRKRGAISVYLSPELIAEWRKVSKKK
jgi:cell division septum initiation protein DivIVA